MCLNCESSCPEDVIKFKFLPNRKRHGVDARRPAAHRVLAAAGAGALFLPAARIADSLDVNYQSKVIRPPGATSRSARSSSDASAVPSA